MVGRGEDVLDIELGLGLIPASVNPGLEVGAVRGAPRLKPGLRRSDIDGADSGTAVPLDPLPRGVRILGLAGDVVGPAVVGVRRSPITSPAGIVTQVLVCQS